MKIAGIINPQVIGAFMLTLVVAFILYFLVLSKYKTTLKVNKSPIKAYRETFKRNNPIIIDTYVTLIIFALVTYFLGNNAEQFAIYLAVNSIISALSLLAVERFIMFLTCDWFNKNEIWYSSKIDL
jgi:Na+-driven multidrug efflux pump